MSELEAALRARLDQMGLKELTDEELASKEEPLAILCAGPPALVPDSIVTDCDDCGDDIVVSPSSLDTVAKAAAAGRETFKFCPQCMINRLKN